MVKLWKSDRGLVHIVQAGYICNPELGKLKPNEEGDRDNITCKNCIQRLNC